MVRVHQDRTPHNFADFAGSLTGRRLLESLGARRIGNRWLARLARLAAATPTRQVGGSQLIIAVMTLHHTSPRRRPIPALYGDGAAARSSQYSSADAVTPPPTGEPPVTRTLPLLSIVAACAKRAVVIFPADVFATAFLISAGLLLLAILVVGTTAMLRVRGARRSRLQMKRHLQRIGTGGGIG